MLAYLRRIYGCTHKINRKGKGEVSTVYLLLGKNDVTQLLLQSDARTDVGAWHDWRHR